MYIEHVLDDHQHATKGAPTNKAIVKCRIEAIILTTLAQTKRYSGHSHPRLQSLDVQFDREIHLVWKIDRKNVNLSGVVDYSLWDGTPSEHVTNTAVLKAETTAWLQRGIDHCLTYMGKCISIDSIS
jgi:hypothetical protein